VNTPNKLTLLRIMLIPLFIVLLFAYFIPQNYLLALVVFAVASLTDLLDGYLARKNNLITDFGKLMDPLADKLLVISAIVCFIELRLTPSVIVVIILARELMVTSMRLVAAGKGSVLAADKWGKYKTVSQMVWIIAVLLMCWLEQLGFNKIPFSLINYSLTAIATLLTVVSGVNYLWQNREIFKNN